jgi:hypothetical protein
MVLAPDECRRPPWLRSGMGATSFDLAQDRLGRYVAGALGRDDCPRRQQKKKEPDNLPGSDGIFRDYGCWGTGAA